MRTQIAVAVCALALSAHPQEPTSPVDDWAESRSDEDRPLVVRDTAREAEEVIVTAAPPDPGMVPTFEFMQQTYESRGKGACLYISGRYDEAFPYLQAAARKGFKLAQARLGFLYQQGLGTDRDPYAAVGWYGVASTGTTLPEIRNRFRDVWRRIPEEYQPEFTTVVNEYRARYGSRHHRVDCDLSFRSGTFLKKLTCRFRDEGIHVDHGPLVQAMVEDRVQESGILDNPFPTSTPLRAGSFGC
ncbi:MAG: sel1 repeat family protein [Pseudomonadales bacterium]|nr:sel1 repeat family protein [Pseudomonadales bacterium]